jgi:hypothetical protein
MVATLNVGYVLVWHRMARTGSAFADRQMKTLLAMTRHGYHAI